MNRLHLAFLISFILMSLSVSGQTTNGNEINIEVSKEKTVINGIKYYLHTVRKGENIYRISIAYGVTQKDILMTNPEVLSGTLKEGQILKIPVTPVAGKAGNQFESDKFIHHIIEENQTIFFLTQKYKITQEELFKYNPELEISPLQVGQIVNIPKPAVTTAEPSPVVPQPQKFIEYKVRRRETKYSIAKQFNITVDELIQANPILNSEDLKTGEYIRIPDRNNVEVIQKPIVAKVDSVIKSTKNTGPCNTYVPNSDSFTVAMLLPFFLEENQTYAQIDSINDVKQSIEANEIYQRTLNFVEFYQGALLAIDSLKKTGFKVKIYTYDASRDTNKIARILKRPEMKNMDLIIGPFYADAVEQVNRFSLQNKIKMISPVSNNCTILKTNPYLYNVIPSDSVYVEAMLKYISTIPDKNIILVFSDKPNDKELSRLYKERLNQYYFNQYKLFIYNNNSFQINSLISANKTNIIILPTEDESLASTILPMLNMAVKNSPIKVFGLPVVMKWKNVDPEYFHNLEFHFCSSFYADYSTKELKQFLVKYKKYNFTQPYFHTRENYPYLFTKEGYNFGFLGYDITFYFLNALSKYGPTFENCVSQQRINLIHSKLNFEKYSSGGGYINSGINILKYTQDYNLIKVN